MQLTAAPARAPEWDEHNVHLWWQAGVYDDTPRARRGRIDGLLRDVLARYVELEPAALRFGREAHGRPFLLGGGPDFNLSDTDGGSLVAVAAQPRVGLDLERTDREPSHRRLAERYFGSDECAALAALSDEDARHAFLQLWTAKEASCKSTGSGIYGQLHRWQFAPESDAPLLRQLPDEAAPASRWHFVRLSPASDYTAVLACDGFVPRPRAFAL
jgi:4'-phosphopantetheinyl transferase